LNQLDENENSNRASHNPFRRDTFHGRIPPDNLELKIAGAMQPRASGKFAERLWKTVPGASIELHEFENVRTQPGIRPQPEQMRERSSGNGRYYSIARTGL
jgi:hypothetical protein